MLRAQALTNSLTVVAAKTEGAELAPPAINQKMRESQKISYLRMKLPYHRNLHGSQKSGGRRLDRAIGWKDSNFGT